MKRGVLLTIAVFLAAAVHGREHPNIVLITVDTLRADHLSAFGYERETSPNIDALLAEGWDFRVARTVEPLTSPALTSMLTSLPPEVHGATRNGLRAREGLLSLPGILRRRGWSTAAFVSNWTLRDHISRLGDHFDQYEAVLTRRRWFGLVRREATAADVSARALEWIKLHHRLHETRPYFVWVHFVEPHAPYRCHDEQAERLGLPAPRHRSKEDCYDAEIALVDDEVGRLLATIDELEDEPPLVVFAADHGESLGERGEWGHGRHLYETTLHVPLGLRWAGHLEPRRIETPVTLLDVPPTLLELLDLPVPETFHGVSRVPSTTPPASACYQAHKGALQVQHDSSRARSRGLLEVAVIDRHHKEVRSLIKNSGARFDLHQDPDEMSPEILTEPSAALKRCLDLIRAGLDRADDLPTDTLDEEAREKLRSLGYLD